jgi:hypothetical protein
MAMGIPIFSSPEEEYKNFLEKHDLGWSPSDWTVESFSKTLSQMISDKVGLKRKSSHCLELHKKEFYFEKQFKSAMEAYNRLCPPQKGLLLVEGDSNENPFHRAGS